MCLNNLWSKKRKEKWLQQQGEYITAYKVVDTRFKNASPPIYCSGTLSVYKKTNKISSNPKEISTSHTKESYLPLFHLFYYEKDAEGWKLPSISLLVLKCQIPKNAVTEIGLQDGAVVIVTKEFTFVDEKFHCIKKEIINIRNIRNLKENNENE